MFYYKTPSIIKSLAPGLTWNKQNGHRGIYLTFDDGPVKGVTDWVLDLLNKKSIKATFFCVGENAQGNLQLMARIVDEGHSVGNHTFNHLDGWKTTSAKYLQNIEKCEKVISSFSKSKLFRPPHGRLNLKASRTLKKGYEIVMWDVLVGDYKNKFNSDKSLIKSGKAVRAGSIIVFHDSRKSEANMKSVLPQFIDDMLKRNFQFCKL